MFKTKKIVSLIICFLFFFSVFCFSVSAEMKNDVIDFDLTKLQIQYTSGDNAAYTPWKDITPKVYQSPYGGSFYGARDGGDLVSNTINWNSNWYFNNQIQFKPNVKYTFEGYFCVPWDKLVTIDDYWNFNLLKIELIDQNRNSIYQLDYSNSYKQSSWIKRKFSHFGVDFGFYPIKFSFTPSKYVKGWYFSVFIGYGLLVAPNNRGNFGFSDLTLSYEVDNSQNIIDNQNQNTQDIIDNQNSNADKEIQAEQDLYEQEKQEAEESGNDSVDGALENMPNDSEGIIDSFGSFIGTMLHTNTDCSIDFPELKTPSIGGLPSYTLSEKQAVNFNEFEELIPKSIMLIVRALLTIALIIFCYKELYSTIQYVVSLKKGGGD